MKYQKSQRKEPMIPHDIIDGQWKKIAMDINFSGSKMTISGRPEIGLEDVPWTFAAHRFDVLRTSIDPKMVQILTKIFKTILKKLIFIKVLDNHLYTQKA